MNTVRAFLMQNAPRLFMCVRACGFLFFPVVLFFILWKIRKKAKLRGQWETSSLFTPLPASGYTCIAMDEIINVQRVNQVEAPKSIYPTAFCARVKCIVRNAIVCARSRMRASIIKYEQNRVGIVERRNFTSIKTDSTSRNEDRSILSSFARWVD